MPSQLKLESYQYMGQETPYANEEESDLEESDDEDEFENMTDRDFKNTVIKTVTQIMQKEYDVDCALINMNEMRHAYSKNIQTCAAAIYPAVFGLLNTMIEPSMKQKQKLSIIKDVLSQFYALLDPFVKTVDDQHNVIHMAGVFCSKQAHTHDCFHLILKFLLADESNDIGLLKLEPKVIIEWINLTKEKIEKGPEEKKDSGSEP